MARPVNTDNPLVLWRHAMRSLRSGGRLTENPRHAALRDRIEIALFRVPARQREVVKRYDLSGEPAVEIQRALGISARQFFRDRRAALTELKTLLPNLLAPPPAVAPVPDTPPRSLTQACDATLSGRASARSLAQTGNAQCLNVLHELAANATDATARTDLFLELAELALDFDDDSAARDAVEAVLRVRNDTGKLEPGLWEYLSGRLARTEARLTGPYPDAATKLREAVAWLRRSVAAYPGAMDTRAALLEALGDAAVLDFEAGNFASARAASAEAVHMINPSRFGRARAHSRSWRWMRPSMRVSRGKWTRRSRESRRCYDEQSIRHGRRRRAASVQISSVSTVFAESADRRFGGMDGCGQPPSKALARATGGA